MGGGLGRAPLGAFWPWGTQVCTPQPPGGTAGAGSGPPRPPSQTHLCPQQRWWVCKQGGGRGARLWVCVVFHPTPPPKTSAHAAGTGPELPGERGQSWAHRSRLPLAEHCQHPPPTPSADRTPLSLQGFAADQSRAGVGGDLPQVPRGAGHPPPLQGQAGANFSPAAETLQTRRDTTLTDSCQSFSPLPARGKMGALPQASAPSCLPAPCLLLLLQAGARQSPGVPVPAPACSAV